MKKLLVILILSAGFVTVASAAETTDCNNPSKNKCCIDVVRIQSEISQAPNHVVTIDDYPITVLYTQVDTSQPGRCETPASYLVNGITEIDTFKWVPGYMEGTFFPVDSI